MKSLSKLTTASIIVMVLFFATNLKAQTTPANAWRMGIGFDSGLPTGNLTFSSKLVLGGTIDLQYGISNNFAITLTSGADHFLSKINPVTNHVFDSFGVIPIKLGIKEFFAPNIYFGAQTGIAIEETDSGAGNTKFALVPALGYANSHWDFSARYEHYSGQGDPYGFVALRIAYGFAL